MKPIYHSLLFLLLVACDQPTENTSDSTIPVRAVSNGQFNEYWYAGKAEVSSYNLNQARYGEMRKGSAVLIFVTEPFSKEKQVKLDNASKAGDDKLTVMKLNFTKKFETGIYPYSMMLSAFTPVSRNENPNTVKVSMSGQEWCGQVFAQMNLHDEQYHVQSFSYFESEGDKKFDIENALLEDEVWNLIRIDYKSLPTGRIKIVPGLFATRLMHDDLKPLQAEASLNATEDQITYSIQYQNGRSLSITFGTTFPHKILSWEETYTGIGGKKLTTTGKLKESLYIDYWTKNSNADSHLRDSLKLN